MKSLWFRSKKVGWGWGLPIDWRGWAVYLLSALALAKGTPLVHAAAGRLWSAVYVVAVTAVLIAICWAKGERPKWRWGGK